MADEPSYQEFPSAYLLQDFIISLQRDWQDMNIASQKTLQLQAAVLARMCGPGEVVVPVEIECALPEWKASDNSQSYWAKCLAVLRGPG